MEITNPAGQKERHELGYLNVNTELAKLPFTDQSFDCILFCEVLEHLTIDPVFTLLELHRVLKPSGHLILTTPNVARLENVARLMAGANLYDPYSGYGPYGRHNREYTRHELWHLLRHLGFEPEIMFTADVTENRAGNYSTLEQCEPLLSNRLPDLGQYHFTRSRKAQAPNVLRPAWLYRSLPKEQMDPTMI